MSYPVFTFFNVLGAVVWGVGLTLLGYWLGQFEIIQDLLEPIFVAIVRGVHRCRCSSSGTGGRKAAKRAAGETA